MSERVPMDVTVGWGKEYLARLMRAVVRLDCTITDTFVIGGREREPAPREWVYLRVQIPADSIEDFRADVGPHEMRPPPRVSIGMESPGPSRCATCGKPESNHPYRHPFTGATP
jgi:hypothetical protein